MIEVQIITKILKTKDIEWLFNKPYFDNPELWSPYHEEYKFIYDHYMKYNEIMDEQKFASEFTEFSFEPVEQSNESLLDEMDEATHYKMCIPPFNQLNDYTSNSFDFVDKAEELVEKSMSYRQDLKMVCYNLSEIVKEYLDNITDADFQKIKTGFPELDEEMNGGLLCNKELVGVLASSGAGKTWTMLKMALAGWECEKHVGIVSAEMDATECLERMCVLKYKVDYNEVIERKHDDKLREMIEDMQENPIYIMDPVSWKRRNTAHLRKWVKQCNIDTLYIDGGQYVECNDEDEEKDWAKLMKMQRELYQISCDLKIPIIVSFQCNRNGTKESRSSQKPPLPENIGESSKIIEACTKVLSIGRYDNEFKIAITKSRKTREGTILVYDWDLPNGKYKYLRSESYEEIPQSTRQQRIDRQVEISMENTRRRGQRPTV